MSRCQATRDCHHATVPRPRPPGATAPKTNAIEVSVDLDGTGGDRGVDRPAVLRPHARASSAGTAASTSSCAATGDLDVDAHHTVEDVGIVLGGVLAEALGDKAGIRRFASISLPLDEALVEVALDLSGRPYLAYGIDFAPDTPGLGSPPFDPQLAEEFWRAFVTAAGRHAARRAWSPGKNTHHIVEAAFKGVARCAAGRRADRGRGDPVHQGHAVTPSSRRDRRPRLRDRQPALGREGPPARGRRRPAGRRTRAEAAGADGVVLPGGRGLRRLRGGAAGSGLDDAARDAVARGRAVPRRSASGSSCSTRAPRRSPGGRRARGPRRRRCRRLAGGVKHPQMQWNALDGCRAALRRCSPASRRPAWVYFVHSYAPVPTGPATRRSSRPATTAAPVAAMAERGRLWGTQFHPEKSGRSGLGILADFAARCGAVPHCAEPRRG